MVWSSLSMDERAQDSRVRIKVRGAKPCNPYLPSAGRTGAGKSSASGGELDDILPSALGRYADALNLVIEKL
jgi:hypothetical protein